MTTYAHDPAASALVAVWSTGDGAVAQKVARVPPSLDPAYARRAADALTTLSARLWLAYTDDEVAGVPLDELPGAVLRPHQPVGDLMRIEDDDRVETAHRIGRIVSIARGRAFRDAVARDVAAEAAAIRAADRGDLTGRAQQAVAHTRPRASDAQLVAAHTLLFDDPLGPVELSTTVDPTAAGVAALRWLRAAAATTALLVEHQPIDVIALAQAIGHEDLRVARFALQMVSGATEDAVVWDLLHEAVLAARGRLVVCPDRYDAADGDTDEAGHRIITTVLDPREPGRSLVGGLVGGIQGCFRVYLDELSTREHPGTDPMFSGELFAAEVRERFRHEVRQAMRSTR